MSNTIHKHISLFIRLSTNTVADVQIVRHFSEEECFFGIHA